MARRPGRGSPSCPLRPAHVGGRRHRARCMGDGRFLHGRRRGSKRRLHRALGRAELAGCASADPSWRESLVDLRVRSGRRVGGRSRGIWRTTHRALERRALGTGHRAAHPALHSGTLALLPSGDPQASSILSYERRSPEESLHVPCNFSAGSQEVTLTKDVLLFSTYRDENRVHEGRYALRPWEAIVTTSR